MSRVLYLSHTGLTEPLGVRQVLPYLFGLRDLCELEIISFEPAATSASTIDETRQLLARAGLRWQPLKRSASHGFGRKLVESSAALLHALASATRRAPDLVHARSHLPSAVGDLLTRIVPSSRLLFDCRGLVGDEYVDSGHWSAEMARYRILKRWERRLFAAASGVVVLTRALHAWLEQAKLFGAATRSQVIPCCVDTALFRPDPALRRAARARIGAGERLVLVYSGSLGVWYRHVEMAELVARIARRRAVKLLILSRSDPGALEAAACMAGLSPTDIVVCNASPAEMPALLCAGDVGLSLIDDCFSKRASSPTKVAEYLACGLGAAVSAIGDQAELGSEPACTVLASHDQHTLEAAAEWVVGYGERPWDERAPEAAQVAHRRFDLATVGIPRYRALYRELGV